MLAAVVARDCSPTDGPRVVADIIDDRNTSSTAGTKPLPAMCLKHDASSCQHHQAFAIVIKVLYRRIIRDMKHFRIRNLG